MRLAKPKIQYVVLATSLAVVSGAVYVWKFTPLPTPPGESVITNLTDNRNDYPSGRIPKYEKFELTFDINKNGHNLNEDIEASAINPYWPYDQNPPSNTQENINSRGDGQMPVEPEAGISVDGIFLKPGRNDWNDPDSIVIQPGFYFQDYEYTQKWNNVGGPDRLQAWFYPVGNPVWKIRFAPTAIGEWQYKVRVRDAAGTSYSSVYTFNTAGSNNHGFVRVDPTTDPRYFETSDGSYLNLVGMADHDFAAGSNRYFIDPKIIDEVFPKLKQNGINLIRPWWQASQGPALFGLSGQGGLAGWMTNNISMCPKLDEPGEFASCPLAGGSDKTISNDLFSFNVGQGQDESESSSFYAAGTFVSVKPGTAYKLSAEVKTVNLTGTDDFGFHLLAPNNPQEKITGTTDWQEVNTSFTTSIPTLEQPNAGNFIGWVGFEVVNKTGGEVYVNNISLKEDLGNGNFGPEIFSKPDPNTYKYVSQDQAWLADYMVNAAKANDIYLKVVAEEKKDITFGNIGTDGTARINEVGDLIPLDSEDLTNWLYGYTNDNPDLNPAVYKNNSAGRVYQMYYWRYLIARYGYSTNIHSFDLVNEGSPDDWKHMKAAGAMANYFNQNDPNRHLVTTSFYHTLKSYFIENYRDIGYGDWHKYIGDNIDWNICGHPCDYNDAYVAGWWSWSIPYYLNQNPKPADPPDLLYLNHSSRNLETRSNSFPVAPGHIYRLTYRIKGQNLIWEQGSSAYIHPDWSTVASDSNCYTSGDFIEGGTFDWKAKDPPCSFTMKSWAWNTTLIVWFPPNNVNGEVWFDDIILYDETAGKPVEFLNGNFEENRLDYDSALLVYNFGYQVGEKDNRQIKKPVIIGETGIAGSALTELDQDTGGVWYKKFIWGHINPFGVTAMYWILDANDDFLTKGFGKYAKAYQDFMADIYLSNGHYQNTDAQSSNPNLRAWGQKDLTNNKAHLWIDNKPYTWKNVVDGNIPPPISGTVTISGFTDGNYTLEWWDTSTGEIVRTEIVASNNGSISFTVQNLVSDVAVKIEKANTPPQLNVTLLSSNEPVTSLTINVGESVNLNVSATDIDNDDLTLRYSPLQENVDIKTMMKADGYARWLFMWTPTSSQAGHYILTFTAEDGRGGADSKDVEIIVNDVSGAPTAGNLAVDDFNNTVCGRTDRARIRLSWTFQSQDPRDAQTAYQIQIIGDGGFDTKRLDGNSQSFVNNPNPPEWDLLEWNMDYTWRLKVWNKNNVESDWIEGHGIEGQGSGFKTPEHSYPSVDFDWTPKPPLINEPTQFSDKSECYDSDRVCDTYYWDIIADWQYDLGSSPTSQNPLGAFIASGAKRASLKVSDNDNFFCFKVVILNAGFPLPEWRETSPSR